MEREAGRRNAEVVQQHAASRGGAHLLFQQELTSEELELAQQGGAWLLHWRKECLSQVAREKVKGESESPP